MKTKMEQLESDMAGLYDLHDALETIIYAVGDSEIRPTEDQLMNMLIGVIELHKWRYDKLWQTYDAFCKDKGLGEYEESELGAAYIEKRLNNLYKSESFDENECEVALPENFEKEDFNEFKGMEDMKTDENNT